MDYPNTDWSGSHCLVTKEKWTWAVVNTCCMDSRSGMNMCCCCQSSAMHCFAHAYPRARTRGTHCAGLLIGEVWNSFCGAMGKHSVDKKAIGASREDGHWWRGKRYAKKDIGSEDGWSR